MLLFIICLSWPVTILCSLKTNTSRYGWSWLHVLSTIYYIYLYIILGCVDQKEKLVTLDMPGFSSQRYYTTPQWIGLECIMEGPNGSWSTSSSKQRSSKQFWSGDRHFTAKQRKTFILPVCACMCEYTSNILYDFKCYKRLREKQTNTHKQGSTDCCDGFMRTSWTLAGMERTQEVAMVAFAWDNCTVCCKEMYIS